MKKDPLSRRDFLKVTWASIWGFILVACGIDVDDETTPTPTSVPTSTDTPVPEPESVEKEESAPTNTPTETPTQTPNPCFQLLTPENDAVLETAGIVTFSWQEETNAESYKLEIILPNGYVEEKMLAATIFERYLGSLPLGGEYQWQVTAMSADGSTICIAESFQFTKNGLSKPSGDNGGNSAGSDSDDGGSASGGGPTPGGGPNNS